jgi:hypothetical protein
MATNKDKASKLQTLIQAWEDHAADKTFGGMTLPQFRVKVQPSLDARAAVEAAQNSRRAAALMKIESDSQSIETQQRVISAIKGDPDHGDDSVLYQACGYVPRSQKKSGLGRKAKTATPEQKAA